MMGGWYVDVVVGYLTNPDFDSCGAGACGLLLGEGQTTIGTIGRQLLVPSGAPSFDIRQFKEVSTGELF